MQTNPAHRQRARRRGHLSGRCSPVDLWPVRRQPGGGVTDRRRVVGEDTVEEGGDAKFAPLFAAVHGCVRARLGESALGREIAGAIDAQGRFLGGLILPGHGIMLRALESGTAGLHVPTGEVRHFPTNTSDALTSGGTFAIAGAIERMVQNVREHCGQAPACIMTGGAGWKMVPSMQRPFELVDNLIFDGLLEIARRRLHPGGAPG